MIAPLPAEPRQPTYDVDEAEERLHGFLTRAGITERRTLWAGTLTARATVWVAHTRRLGMPVTYAEQVLRLAITEVRAAVLRHQLQSPNLHRHARPDLELQLARIDFDHLPLDLKCPPPGWMETDNG